MLGWAGLIEDFQWSGTPANFNPRSTNDKLIGSMCSFSSKGGLSPNNSNFI